MAEEPRDLLQRNPLRDDDDNTVAIADASRQKSKSPPPVMTKPASEVPRRREGHSPERRADAAADDEGKRRARSRSNSREDRPQDRDRRRSRSRSKSRGRDGSRDLRRRDERSSRRRSRSASRARSRRDSGRDDRRRPRSRSRDRRKDRSRSRGDRRRRQRSSSRDRRRRRYSSSRSRSRSRRGSRRSRSPMYARPLGNLGVGVPSAAHLPVMASFPNMAMPGGIATMPHMQQMAGYPNMAPSHIPASMPPNQFPNMAPSVAPTPPVNHATRSQRRLYIGGIPNPCFDFQLVEFLSSTLLALGLVHSTRRPPIIKAEIHQERGFAFIEFVDINDCTACMQLDGIIYTGSPLKIKRPKDFIQPFGTTDPAPLGPAAIAALLAQKTGIPPPQGIPMPGVPSLSPE